MRHILNNGLVIAIVASLILSLTVLSQAFFKTNAFALSYGDSVKFSLPKVMTQQVALSVIYFQ